MGTLIFSYIRRLGSFLGFEILNFNFSGGGGGFRKIYIFGGMNFLGSSQNWTIFRGHFYAF